MPEPHWVRILEPRIPSHVVCPYCGIKQPFVKETEYWRTVKVPHLQYPLAFKIRMVCAKCRNPDCSQRVSLFPFRGSNDTNELLKLLFQKPWLGSFKITVLWNELL